MSRPAIFIGSSSEGIEFARAIRSLLNDTTEVTVWNEGFFTPGNTFIETLVEALPRFDFAAVVLTPDDLVTSRDVTKFGPRDNALFELGLFMGVLGRSRTFVVHPESDNVKLPSDLAGVTTVGYYWPREDGNYMSAVGGAGDEIRQAIRRHGLLEGRVTRHLRDVENEQQRQQGEIDGIIRLLLQTVVTAYERDHLLKLRSGEPFTFEYSKEFEAELRHLLALALLKRKPGRGITTMFEDGDDVSMHLELTKRGRSYLEFHEQFEQFAVVHAERATERRTSPQR
jgi:hypothetical protein